MLSTSCLSWSCIMESNGSGSLYLNPAGSEVRMSTRKRTKGNTANGADEPETPSRVTRSKTPSKAAKVTTPVKNLADDEDFRKNGSDDEKPISPKTRKETPRKHAGDAHKKEEIHYEFNGPIGAVGIIVGLPIVTYMLYFLCNDNVCLSNPLQFDWQKFAAQINVDAFFSKEATFMYLGWMAFSVLLERILPGEYVEGTILPNTTDKRLGYTMSGHLQFWVSLIAVSAAIPLISISTDGADWWHNVYQVQGFAPLRLELIYDHYVQLITVSVLFTTLMSVYLYVSSFKKGAQLAKGGNTGSVIYDFFIGRELNPRIGNLDLKEFCELRPGLIGWFVINLGMATKQYLNRQALTGTGSVSLSMLLVTALQGFYVWDAVYMEKAILTTMDITTDGFGFMLCFGDMAWVPFIYTLQARYLVDHDPSLPLWQVLIIVAIQLLGYYIFRSANSQKDAFRTNPDGLEVRHLEFLQTQRGTKLLTSGWWGAARKINYTGDWLVTVSWCLLCGFDSPIPYFQAVYFAILLVHRAIRDDETCAEKYGADWEEYKRIVPYWFIPGVI